MKVSYTPEQRQEAIRTYRRLKSYEKTIRVLGYPSRHVLFGWVKNQNPKPAPKRPQEPAKRYPWALKKEAVERPRT